jgi:ABC-type multidrug transport system fused ATPase/permease subunit
MLKRLNQNFKELVQFQTKEFKWYYFFGVIFLFLTHKIQSELPFLARDLSLLVADKKNNINVQLFFWYALGIIIFRTSSRILFFYPARLLQKSLREELLSKIQNASPFRYRTINAGQLFQYLTGDIDQIRALIGFVGLQGGNFVIGLLVLVPKMLNFNRSLMWALTPMILSFFIFTYIVSKNRIYFKKTQEAQGEVQNLIIESYQGKKTIKNFQSEKPFVDLFEKLSLKELYYFYRSSVGISITLPMISFGVGLSMLWGAYIIKTHQLGAGTLILFSGFIFLFMEPLGYLSWIGVVVSRSHASWKRLYDLNIILETESTEEKKLLANNLSLPVLEFKFDYWDRDLNLKFIDKKWNVIVAKTGHGKSVLLEKICQILMTKKKSVSFVFQDPYIYNDTIQNNIFLGTEVSPQMLDEARKFLKILGLDYLEKDLDKLLNLEVGENGKRLSGGQAKRLTLIRSLLSQSEIIIWDDPFSSVDLILEKEIIQLLKNEQLVKDKTIILTAHRLSTVRNCDYVVLLDKDEHVLESGPLSELINENSKLYEYFQKQMV